MLKAEEKLEMQEDITEGNEVSGRPQLFSQQASRCTNQKIGRVCSSLEEIFGLVCSLVMQKGRLVILLLEDDESDILFVKHATERAKAGHQVYAVNNGQQAIAYLRGEDQYADRRKFPLPNVILTDLKMPGMNGFEFLQWLRAHPDCSIIPTIVYSSSRMESDVLQAYRLGANAFVTKPSGLQELAELLNSMCDFWSRCECPTVPANC